MRDIAPQLETAVTFASSDQTVEGIAIAEYKYLRSYGGQPVRIIASARKGDGTIVSASTQFNLPVR